MRQNDLSFVRSLLERRLRETGARGAQPSTGQEAVDYDWTVPSRFTQAQMARIDQFAATAVEELSRALSGMLNQTMQVQPKAATQQYGTGDRNSGEGAADYWAPVLDASGSQCGALIIPAGCAASWVASLLGSAEDSAGDDRDLSSLESSLLMDIASVILRTLNGLLSAKGAAEIRLDDHIARGEPALACGDGSEFCRITFCRHDSPDEQAFSVLLLGDLLDPVAQTEGADPSDQSSQDRRAEIVGHLAEAKVTSVAWLGDARLSMQEILALEPGDVLVLERKIAEPVGLYVQGARVLWGLPAKCCGQYALKIMKPPNADEK